MLNKILKITAAAAFMVALAINIDMTLNDPFTTMSIEAIATDTDSGTTGSGICEQYVDNWMMTYYFCNDGIEYEETGTYVCGDNGTGTCLEGVFFTISYCDGTLISSGGNDATCI